MQKVAIKKEFVGEKYECYFIEDDIFYFHYFEDMVIELEDVLEGVSVGKKISSTEDVKILVHVERYVTFTKEAREYLQDNMISVKAEAHVIPQLANKIVFSFFMKWRSSKHPLKAFSKMDTALEWIRKVG
jgi:hypothetical protein